MKDKYDIFISYRREGGYDTAKHLNDLLVHDGYRVSFDIDTLRSGDFDEQLYDRIDQCEDFILIVDAHAFDRSLDPKSDPTKDWLRCELAYALKKGKNIIPVFLAGVKSFPENLPDDIKAVEQKNGPEYNRYYFNDFYRALKTRFLSATPYKRIMKYAISATVIIALILFGVLLAKKYYIPNPPNEVNPDTTIVKTAKDTIVCEPIFSCTQAKEIVANVLKRRPMLAYGYNDGKDKIVALRNDDSYNLEAPLAIFNEQKLSICVLAKEGGVWNSIKDFTINVFNNKNDAMKEECFEAFLFEDTCQVIKFKGKYYFYIRFQRGHVASEYGFPAEAHDYIAVDLENGKISQLTNFISEKDKLTNSGVLIKDSVYPDGVEDFLLKKSENDSTVKKAGDTEDPNDISIIIKNWFLDNSEDMCNFEKMEYNKEYQAKVRYYGTRPQPTPEDIEYSRDSYFVYDTGDYILYGRYGGEDAFKGSLYAYDKKEQRYFLVWGEETETSYENWKSIIKIHQEYIYFAYSMYINEGEVGDVIKYNLENHTLRKEKLRITKTLVGRCE